MSAWDRGAEKDPERDVLAARMETVPGPTGVNPIADLLAEEVLRALENLSARRVEAGRTELPGLLRKGLPALAATAIGPIEGVLKSKSLEGALKEAQILAAYAESRERNANADKLEAEAELARIAVARARLEAAMEACQKFGVDPLVALSARREPTVVLGTGLVEQHLPPPAAPPQLAAGGEPGSGG